MVTFVTRIERVLAVLVLAALLPLAAGAQEVPSVPSLPPTPETPAGTVNCFDYYRFGSVQVDLGTTLPQTIPGVPLTFTGTLKNENAYPLTNGSVYVKIFKHDQVSDARTKQNGYPLVAFFEAGKDISIPASSEQPFSFEWVVPQSLSGGEYEADFFFVTDHRFNLLGLTFTDDVTGNKTTFNITSPNEDQVVFDKNSVTLNSEGYSFAAFPPHFTADEPVTVSAKLVNPSNVTKNVTLMWSLYNWDGLRGDQVLGTESVPVTLKAGESKTVSYEVSRRTGAVSYVLGAVADGDATSIINPRFVRDDIEEIRLNFPSLTSFPLEAGKESTVFSCLHSTNFPVISGGELTLSLTNAATGDLIHEYTYAGDVTGAMMGVKDSFTPDRAYGNVTLTTTLKLNGEVIDTVSATYDCATLSPDNCPGEPKGTGVLPLDSDDPSLMYTLAIVAIAGLLVVLLVLIRRRKATEAAAEATPEMHMPKE